MAAPIIPAGYATPIDAFQFNFGLGGDAPAAAPRALLIVANRSTAGTGVVDTVYGPTTTPALQNETDVNTLAGPGSEAHRLWRRVRSVFAIAQAIGVTPPPVSMIFPPESGGNQATLDIVLTNDSTASTPLTVYCGDDSTDVQLTVGELVDTIGAAVVVSVNNNAHWPVTAAYNTGTNTVTFTAKNHGPRGNEIRMWAAVQGTNATTVSVTVSTALSGGTTEDSWTNTLATLSASGYYYIVSPSTNMSGTNFDDLVTQVKAQADPLVGIWQIIVAGHVGTQSAASTVAANVGVNSEVCDIVWQQSSEFTAGELAAKFAAVRAVFEEMDPTFNFDGFGGGKIQDIQTDRFWDVPAQQTQSARPSPTTIETALNSGITPIAAVASGQTYIVRSITTRHKNGSNFDYSVRDSHITSGIHFFATGVRTEYKENFGGCKLIDDLSPGEPPAGPRVVQPKQVKAMIFRRIDEIANVHLKKATEIKAGVIVIRSLLVNGRLSITIPLRIIDLLHQSEWAINDLSAVTA